MLRAMNAAAAPIAFQGLSKRYASTNTLAVDGLTLEVRPGRVTGLLGPNGAGKTTALRTLLGLIAPTSGAALVDGRPYRQLEHPARAVGAVLESSGFHPGRSGRDHLRVLAIAAGVPPARADEMLELVGLTGAARKRAGAYSLGMRQRLALAAALLGDPPVLILDEPANGLDPEGIRWLREFIRARAAAGGTVLLSSHVLAEVAQTVDEVAVIDRGRMLVHDTVSGLLARAASGIRLRSPEAERLAGALTAAGIAVAQDGAGALLARDADPDRVGRLIAEHRIVIHEMTPAGGTLEDVFLSLTGGEGRDGPAHPG
jgi:ABC-2 type transport system ATP-binding protein